MPEPVTIVQPRGQQRGSRDVIRAPGLDVSLVGPYHPVTFSFDGYRRGVRPADLAGWDSPIMDPGKPTRGTGGGR